MEADLGITLPLQLGRRTGRRGLPEDVAAIVGPVLQELRAAGEAAEASEDASDAAIPREQGHVADESGGIAPLEGLRQAGASAAQLLPEADDTDAAVADAALAKADEAIATLLSGSSRKRSWLRPVAEETSDWEAEAPEVVPEAPLPLAERAERAEQRSVPRRTLFFELTETLDNINIDNIEAEFGLSASTLDKIEEQFSKKERKPQLFYELTEDMSVLDSDWQDSDFGLADWQLEELWRRFDSRVVSTPSVSSSAVPGTTAHGGERSAESERRAKRPADTARRTGGGVNTPCPDVLQNVEEAMESVGLTKLHDFLGDHTLEQFIGQKVPPPPPGGMRVWMLSVRKLDGEDWYLFKVADRGANRFYMKSFLDFEELHAALLAATPVGRSLPALPQRDFLGFKRWMLGSDFSEKRTQQLRAYVDELMAQFLTPSQEQALRNFFSPTARGQVLPPSGETAAAAPQARPFGPRPGAQTAQLPPLR